MMHDRFPRRPVPSSWTSGITLFAILLLAGREVAIVAQEATPPAGSATGFIETVGGKTTRELPAPSTTTLMATPCGSPPR